jgi:hypothetical protein
MVSFFLKDISLDLHEFNVFLKFFNTNCKADFIINNIGSNYLIINVLGDGKCLPYDILIDFDG